MISTIPSASFGCLNLGLYYINLNVMMQKSTITGHIFLNLVWNQHPDRGRAGPTQEELHAGRALREVGRAGRPQLQEPHRTGQPAGTFPLIVLKTLSEKKTRPETDLIEAEKKFPIHSTEMK